VNRQSSQYDYTSLDDFEELLADRPLDEKWEPLGGRVVRMGVGARWEHNRIARNMTTAFMNELRHYVLIERDMLAVDVHDRLEDGFFERPRLTVAQDILRLPAIDFELPLAEIYRDLVAPAS
jgi:Uma2 family endonuclease